MKILISGSSGLVGEALIPALRGAGHEVVRLVRDRAQAAAFDRYWDPATGAIDPKALDACDAVINLSGENIAARRWTTKQKMRIRESRIAATSSLARAMAQSSVRPRVLLNASAIGIYGDRGDEELDETSPAGSGDFLSEVCRVWEAATEPAAKKNVRVVNLRFGVILSGEGGALKKMLLPFQLGLGGKIGSGRQWMSWIALDDVVGATLHCLQNDTLRGPVNLVAPEPATNLQFTKTLGRVLRRPTLFPMPALAARAVFGQMADELLLASQRVEPSRLLGSGYPFRYPTLEAALRHVLQRS